MNEWSLSTLPSPIPELQHTPLPLKVLWVKERAPTSLFFVVFYLDSHLSPLRSWECVTNQEHNSRPPPDLVYKEPEFEVEAVFKSRQLRGRVWEYLVKWKGYHPIDASWANVCDMEHAQETIEELHNRSTKRQRKHKAWWGHHLSFSEVENHTNVSHQVPSEIKAKF